MQGMKREFYYDVAQLDPQVSCPDNVDNVKSISEVAGVKVQQAFLGSCVNGRLEDIEIAANLIRGRKVHPGVRFLVYPASFRVYKEAMKRGHLSTLMEAGAIVMNPGCGPCFGAHGGTLASGEICISSSNRNFKGRMGSRDAKVYLGSPATVTAGAISGELFDFRKL
jgi:homoaconitase/3-isopropylmalate dehydratase large subunit